MSTTLKLTNQEVNIINYLKANANVSWEELVQFAKDPQTVKLKTIKKAVSEIKRKYAAAGLPVPFDTKFSSLAEITPKQIINTTHLDKEDFLGLPVISNTKQTLVKVVKVPEAKPTKLPAQIDFAPDPLGFKKVVTKFGSYQLNDSEWDMYKYFYNNVGKLISLSELRDQVMFPNYGSKLPARWFDAIMRVVNNLRRQVKGLDTRLLTVKGTETSYIFQ